MTVMDIWDLRNNKKRLSSTKEITLLAVSQQSYLFCILIFAQSVIGTKITAKCFGYHIAIFKLSLPKFERLLHQQNMLE
jgi:hypothetical protein